MILGITVAYQYELLPLDRSERSVQQLFRASFTACYKVLRTDKQAGYYYQVFLLSKRKGPLASDCKMPTDSIYKPSLIGPTRDSETEGAIMV